MRVAVPKESAAHERRVALVPESAKRLAARRVEVVVEAGAGARAHFSDAEYLAAGAAVEPGLLKLIQDSDGVVRVRPPTPAEVARLKEGSLLVAPLYPFGNRPLVEALIDRRLTAVALDLVPRTTVAQSMDVLSSQATAAGYHAVLRAATLLPRFFPMLMTAAGTLAPARVLVLGAGVAGLQAIGTARRLGAVVEAFDVRKVAKEQVESLGAKFVVIDELEDAQAAGGYAKEVSEGDKRKQSAALARHVRTADVVICTALIPGQRAPVLVTAEMVATMKPGSVIVDLAAEQQGNCALTEPGQTVERHGVTVVGELDLPSQLAVHASQMFSRNVEKLLSHLTKDGALALDFKDEITAGCVITHAGDLLHAKVKERLA